MARAFRGYLWLLREYTLPTQMVTGSSMMCIGDAITQHGIQRKPFSQHDWSRTAMFAYYSGLIFAPSANRWHAVLNRIRLSSMPRTVAVRVTVDMLTFAPLMNGVFFIGTGMLQRQPLETIRGKIRTQWWNVYSTGLLLFGPAQILNLSVIPVYARPPFLNVVAILWGSFLATTLNSHETQASSKLVERALEADAIVEPGI